jgi:DtxR family Mn-dependent transcriptional regulator
MSVSKEDYLEEIYRIQSCNNRAARITEISATLNVSKASASEMVKRLSKEHLLESKKYSGVTLTKKGVEQAQKVYRKHQLLEVFFNRVLKLKDTFHTEAHKVEHTLSDEATDRLEKVLKTPQVCPDGNPIPRKKGVVMRLDEILEKGSAEIVFSTTDDKECLERLNSLGIVPGTHVRVLNKIHNGPIILSVKGSELALGLEIISKILVIKV